MKMIERREDVVGKVTEAVTEVDGVAYFTDRAEGHVQEVNELPFSLARATFNQIGGD